MLLYVIFSRGGEWMWQLITDQNQINQSMINPYVAQLLKGWNCYITQFDSLEERSDDEIWIQWLLLKSDIKPTNATQQWNMSTRCEWHRSVAQCIYLDASWAKVKVKAWCYNSNNNNNNKRISFYAMWCLSTLLSVGWQHTSDVIWTWWSCTICHLLLQWILSCMLLIT